MATAASFSLMMALSLPSCPSISSNTAACSVRPVRSSYQAVQQTLLSLPCSVAPPPLQSLWARLRVHCFQQEFVVHAGQLKHVEAS